MQQNSDQTMNDNEELLIDLGNKVTLTLIKIKAGSFMMGSPEDELGRGYNEEQHRVTLTKDYWLGMYPVTQRQYKAVIGRNPSDFSYPDFPVDNVSWHLAKIFCSKLNQMTTCPAGYKFDLPTEAQWEYACRAGTTTALNSGKNITDRFGKCVNLAKIGWYKDNFLPRRNVGKKKPNAWGLYDMHGNVEEWCRDWYEADYASDPEFLNGQIKGDFRVTRGGGHTSDPEECRSASRECYEPTLRYNFVGFRVALVPVK
ncbi:MAG: formylglycine-generating enzyme family protein [Victivallales bacterium]|nr:formylglycine-generating enzyme family protein [Victivallales bacterium]